MPARDRTACVLVSGGLDSAVLLSSAARRYSRVIPLYVSSGLRWERAERRALSLFLRKARLRGVSRPVSLRFDMTDVYGRHWSTGGKKVPGASSPDSAVFLPGRNVTLLAKAATWAAVNGIGVVEIGVLSANPFPDGNERFFRRFAVLLSRGLGRRVAVRAPFRKLTKAQVVKRGKTLPLELTFSCLDPRGARHCGRCNKCRERRDALHEAGVTDRTRYASSGIL